MPDPHKAPGNKTLPVSLGRLPGLERIAPLVGLLLVEDARFIVGRYLIIDGGP